MNKIELHIEHLETALEEFEIRFDELYSVAIKDIKDYNGLYRDVFMPTLEKMVDVSHGDAYNLYYNYLFDYSVEELNVMRVAVEEQTSKLSLYDIQEFLIDVLIMD